MEYTLENETLRVKVQTLGGELSSIQDRDGVEFLWQGDKTYWGGRAPVLFPICGSLRGDRAAIGGGKITEMPRHGIVRKKEFACKRQTAREILFALTSDGEMERRFPYPFCLEIQYTLTENRIRTEYRIINRGAEPMPFFIGGHPGFNCPLFGAEAYEDYRLEFLQPETCRAPLPLTETGLIDTSRRTAVLQNQRILPLSHKLFEKDAVILDEIKSRSVRLLSKNHDKGIQLDFPDFPYLILWSSANQGPFVALEPWLGLSTCSDESDIFEEKRNVRIAESGKEKRYWFDIFVLG